MSQNSAQKDRGDPNLLKTRWKALFAETLKLAASKIWKRLKKDWAEYIKDLQGGAQKEKVPCEVNEEKVPSFEMLAVDAKWGRRFRLAMQLHGLVLGVVLACGIAIPSMPKFINARIMHLVLPSDYLPPDTKGKDDKSGGGGGGGDRDKLQAPKGDLPKFAREQFTPPLVVIRVQDPKLTMTPTVVGPPDIKIAQGPKMGDPPALVGPPSNGTGSGGGIGSGSGGGVGSGEGPGVGPGWGGGIGGGVYRVGGGVSAPRIVFQPDPEYSEEARKAKYQGTVVLYVEIGPDGRIHNVRIQRSLGLGLDEKAIEAVNKWKFEPARKNGQPVTVGVNIEVNFRLY